MSEAQSLPPMRPMLAEGPSEFVLMERAVEAEYRPQMLGELQRRVAELAKTTTQPPVCSRCGRVMVCQDVRSVSWLARFGRLRVGVPRYRCPSCKSECRPLPDLLGLEPGRIGGSLARELAVLAAVVPYTLAARRADLLLGVKISAIGYLESVAAAGTGSCELQRGSEPVSRRQPSVKPLLQARRLRQCC
jgi:hypothetical protein